MLVYVEMEKLNQRVHQEDFQAPEELKNIYFTIYVHSRTNDQVVFTMNNKEDWDPSSVDSVAKGLNNERRVIHHVASSILGSDTLLCLHRGAWGGISVAKWSWE